MSYKSAYQQCINPKCAAAFGCNEILFECPKCADLLDICYEWDKVSLPKTLADFGKRWATRSNRLDFSGVWRFRELLDFCPDKDKISVGEGQTFFSKTADWRQSWE